MAWLTSLTNYLGFSTSQDFMDLQLTCPRFNKSNISISLYAEKANLKPHLDVCSPGLTLYSMVRVLWEVSAVTCRLRTEACCTASAVSSWK